MPCIHWWTAGTIAVTKNILNLMVFIFILTVIKIDVQYYLEIGNLEKITSKVPVITGQLNII